MFVIAFILLLSSICCIIVSVLFLIVGIKEYLSTKETDILFVSSILLVFSILIYSSTFNDRINYTLEQSIYSDEIKSDYNMSVTNIITKNSGYNKYSLINKNTGEIFCITESDYIKYMNCYDFKLNIYTAIREYDITGISIEEKSPNKNFKILCKGDINYNAN